MNYILTILAFFLFTPLLLAQIHTENISYESNGTKLQGFLAYDQSVKDKRPGILVVHEYWGLNDYPKERARQLAELGYVAFAADIYGAGVIAKSPEEAGKLAGQFRNDRTLMRERVKAGLEVLKKQNNVDASKIAAIGYCFGGTVALELARSGADIKGVAAFHAGLDTPTPQDAKNIKGRILVLHGAADRFVPDEQVNAFKKEMDDAKADWQMNIYSGAVHAFTNPQAGNDPSRGAAYNEKADKRSFQAMRIFFDEIFR